MTAVRPDCRTDADGPNECDCLIHAEIDSANCCNSSSRCKDNENCRDGPYCAQLMFRCSHQILVFFHKR